jgi:chemotaxis protein CheX
MDVRYIKPFLFAVKNLFDTMIDLPFKLGQPTFKKEAVTSHEISGIIGISGDVEGCVVIALSKEIALQLGSELLGETLDEIDGDCTDAIGEITNMIAGSAKTQFPEQNTSVSVPSVVVGKHHVSYPSGIPIVSIPCTIEKGELCIDIALKPKNGTSSS